MQTNIFLLEEQLPPTAEAMARNNEVDEMLERAVELHALRHYLITYFSQRKVRNKNQHYQKFHHLLSLEDFQNPLNKKSQPEGWLFV